MTLRRLSAAFACGLLLCTLAACDSSSGIGADVGDDLQGGDPQAIALVPDSSDYRSTATAAPVTGNTRASRAWRFLVGRVQDPLAGTATAHGYFDLNPTAEISTGVLNGDLSNLQAELSLDPQYVHGDSTATVEFAIFDLDDNPDFEDARADATFPDSAQVEGTFTVSADADSVVTIELPASWLEDHLAQLQDTSDVDDQARFRESFKGFRLEARSSVSASAPGAVIGFSSRSSVLRLSRTDIDEAQTYTVSQSFTNVSWSDVPDAAVPADRILLRGGDTQALRAAFDFEQVRTDTLLGAPLNRVRLDFPIDTTAAASLPPDFVRPRVQGYRLLMKRNDDPDVPSCDGGELGPLALQTPETGLDPQDEEGSICFVPVDLSPLPGSVGSSNLFQVVDQSLTPNRPVVFEQFRLEILDRFSTDTSFNPAQSGVPTTSPVLFYGPGAETSANRPLFSIIATPL